MDKCREEFESYLLNNGYSKDALHKSQYCDYYSRSFTRELWKAWQKAWLASRESMKAIRLPNAIKADNRLLGDNEYYSGYNQALRNCEKQITSAGYEAE